MELFELLDIIFSKPIEYSKVTQGDKRKHFFLLNRRMAIYYPLQCQALQRVKMNETAAVDFWQSFISKQYNKTPYWMFTKGVKKVKEEKEKTVNIKESSLTEFSIYFGYDLKSVKEAAKVFPEEFKKEIINFEKIKQS